MPLATLKSNPALTEVAALQQTLVSLKSGGTPSSADLSPGLDFYVATVIGAIGLLLAGVQVIIGVLQLGQRYR